MVSALYLCVHVMVCVSVCVLVCGGSVPGIGVPGCGNWDRWS